MSMHNDLSIHRPGAAAARPVLPWFHGVGPGATTPIGFLQGAIMALESTQLPEPVAGRVIALAGRFAQPPRGVAPQVTPHLLHGDRDRVTSQALGTEAMTPWRTLGGQGNLDRFPGLGHGIDARVVRRVADHLGATPS